MPKALIVGASGQDGAYLAQFLLNKGYEVFGSSRDAEMALFSNFVRLGIRAKVKTLSMATNDFRSVLQTFDRVRPDEVYNLSGQSSVGLSFQQPVEALESISVATLNLLEVIRYREQPIRFYNAASSECFGDIGENAANENTPFKPRSPYASAKAAAFWQVSNYREAYGLFGCSGILFNHESPLRPERFVTQKIVASACRISKGSKEKLHLGRMSIQRDWGWAPEYVEAMWRMLQNSEAKDYVIATGETNSLENFVEAAFSCLKLNWHDHVVSDASLYRPTDLQTSRADPRKAESELSWRAVNKMAQVVQFMVEAAIKA